MATYCLLNAKVIRFPRTTKPSIGFDVRSDKNIPINFEPVVPTTTSTSFVNKIFQGNISWDQVKRDIEISISFPNILSAEDGAIVGTGVMQMKGQHEDHILSKIFSNAHGKVTVDWVVSEFGKLNCSKENLIGWETGGMELNRYQRFSQIGGLSTLSPEFSVLGIFENVPVALINTWKNQEAYQGTFSIYVFVSESPYSCQLELQHQHIMKLKKMLNNCIETDVQLVSMDGGIVKCHRGILAVNSVKLARMLKLQLGRTQVDIMKHLSLDCIKALLKFMYSMELPELNPSIEFAIDVLGAAMEFHFVELVAHAQKYLKAKSNNEFSADDGVALFVIAKSGLEENNSGISEENDESDEDESSENSNENRENVSGEDDNEIGESGGDGNSEADDRNLEAGVQLETGRRSVKRPTTEENGHVKRNRTIYNVPPSRPGKNMQVLSQNLSSVDDNEDIDSDDEDESNSMDEMIFDFRKSLEEKAINIISWHSSRTSNALENSVEYRRLAELPELQTQLTLIMFKKMCEIILNQRAPLV